MRLLKHRNLVVYKLPLKWNGCVHSIRIKVMCLELDDKEKIIYLFKKDKVLQDKFCKFLAKGFRGIVWYNEDEWVSYAWISLPETSGPPHLPRYIRQLPVYWIFYCRTKEEYRGRGLYKASLSILCNWARERDPKAEIYIDTEPSNVPSRKAIEAVGFTPAGIISIWTLGLPKLGSVVIWGSWNKEAKHPGMNV
jgi:GNAT superfamily N-acetyltransferase